MRVHTTFFALKYNIYSSIAIVIWILILLWTLVDRAGAGTITLGEFTALIGSVGTLLGAVERASYLCSVIARRSLLMRYYEEFQALPRVDEVGHEEPKTSVEDGMVVEFQHVFFHYPGSEKEVLRDCSFRIRKGEKVALVGENGAGKSTIVKLLCGLYSPVQGEILLMGKRADAYTPEERRCIMSVVFQDYTSSVNPRFTVRELVSEPLDILRLDGARTVSELLGRVGLPETLLHRYPHELSGGQLQRVCIARAIATNPRFIVFDEAISSLDVSVQAQVLELLLELKGDMTYLFIAHDIQAVTYLCDHILFLHEGTIAESLERQHLATASSGYAQRLLQSVIPFTPDACVATV